MAGFFAEFGHIVTIMGILVIGVIGVAAIMHGANAQLITTCLFAIVALALGRWPLSPTGTNGKS